MNSAPEKLFGLVVLGVCDACGGDGVLWDCDEETHWADRCSKCNCVGYLLDLPDSWKRNPIQDDDGETDHGDIPF